MDMLETRSLDILEKMRDFSYFYYCEMVCKKLTLVDLAG